MTFSGEVIPFMTTTTMFARDVSSCGAELINQLMHIFISKRASQACLTNHRKNDLQCSRASRFHKLIVSMLIYRQPIHHTTLDSPSRNMIFQQLDKLSD